MDVDNAMFEALFQRLLVPSAALASELARAGYDTKVPVPRYPGPVFAACLDLARQHVVPQLERDAGLKELGRRFVAGFRQTILGRIATTALPILGPARFLPQVPKRFASLRSDAHVVCRITSPQSAELSFEDPLPLGPFFAGVIEAALDVARARNAQTQLRPTPSGYVVDARWSA